MSRVPRLLAIVFLINVGCGSARALAPSHPRGFEFLADLKSNGLLPVPANALEKWLQQRVSTPSAQYAADDVEVGRAFAEINVDSDCTATLYPRRAAAGGIEYDAISISCTALASEDASRALIARWIEMLVDPSRDIRSARQQDGERLFVTKGVRGPVTIRTRTVDLGDEFATTMRLSAGEPQISP